MADDYTPPLSPAIVFKFTGDDYVPPLSPAVIFRFGIDDEDSDAGALLSNFMILLTA